MRLLIDECLAAVPLVNMLRSAGHDVVTAVEACGVGATDAVVFAWGKQSGRTILTSDCADFAALHQNDAAHSGILLVYQDGDSRDMTYRDIVNAIDQAGMLNASGFASQLIVVNHHRHPS